MSATVIPESMALLLEKYSPEQIAEVIDAVMKIRPAAAPSAAVASSSPVSTITQRKKRTKKAQGASAHPSNSIAPTRPLNSWMAFRSFHAPIFKTFQQKEISGFLTSLWQNDPFKAKWSILAKAYSIIREHNTKDAAPLDKFLSLTCPYIGIIPRDEYLVVMGWEIVETAGVKAMERRFAPEIASFPDDVLTTNFSAEDIVVYCHRVSYIQHSNSDTVHHQGATAALTMAAQPATNTIQSTMLPTQPIIMATQPVAPASTQPATVSTQPTTVSTQPATVSTQSASSPSDQFDFDAAAPQPQQDVQDDHDLFLAGVIQANLDRNNNGAAGASGPVRQTVHDLSTQEYPFMDEFDPYSTSTLDFDPFNLNHDAAFSSDSLGTYLAPANAEFPETFNIDDLLSSDLFDLTK